jgi:hypothetical protein
MKGDRITSLTVSGERVDAKALSTVPLRHLAQVAAAFLGEADKAFTEGAPVSAAFDGAGADPGRVRRHTGPSPEEFARSWLEVTTGERRKRLADRWGVGVYTIDKWTRTARDRGLIPPPTVGRPRSGQHQGNHAQ